jgi:hypothetical protein
MSEARIAELYTYAYTGEVIGVHLFDGLAGQPWSKGRETGLREAADLERQTRRMLKDLLAAHGVEAMTDEEGIRSAKGYIDDYVKGSWTDWCSALIEWSQEAREKFVELLSLVPHDERGRVEQLVIHEDVLIEYAKASRAGDEAAGLKLLSDHISAYSAPTGARSY